MSSNQNLDNQFLSSTPKPLKKSTFQLYLSNPDSIQNIKYQDKFYKINPEFDLESQYNVNQFLDQFYSFLSLISTLLVIDVLMTPYLDKSFLINLPLSEICQISSSQNNIDPKKDSSESYENIKCIRSKLIQEYNLMLKNYKIYSDIIKNTQSEMAQNMPKNISNINKKLEKSLNFKIRESQIRVENQTKFYNKFYLDLTEMVKISTKSSEIKQINFKIIQFNKISKFVNQKYFKDSENFLYLESFCLIKVLDDETTKFYNEIKEFSYVKKAVKGINTKVFKKFEESFFDCFAFEFIVIYFVVLCIDHSGADLDTKVNWVKDLNRYIKSSDNSRRQSHYKNKWKENLFVNFETIFSVINEEVRHLFEAGFRII